MSVVETKGSRSSRSDCPPGRGYMYYKEMESSRLFPPHKRAEIGDPKTLALDAIELLYHVGLNVRLVMVVPLFWYL